MLRLYTLLIIGAIGVAALVGIFLGFESSYRSDATFLIVTQQNSVSAERVIVNSIYIISAYMNEQVEGSAENTQVIAEQIEDSDILSITTIGQTIDHVRAIEKNTFSMFIKSVKKYYGDDVAVHMVFHDATPQERMITKSVPYILMLCIITGLVASILAIFHVFDHMRHDKERDMAHVDGKRIFEKFNATKKTDDGEEKEDVISPEEIVQESKNIDFMKEQTQKKDIVKHAAVKNKSNMPEEDVIVLKDATTVDMKKKSDVPMPDGLQTIPGNLPVVDVSTLGFSKKNQSENKDGHVTRQV